MRPVLLSGLVALVLSASMLAQPWAAVAQSPPSRVAAILGEHLPTGRLEAGAQALRAVIAAEPAHAEAQYALGGVLLLRAVERFGQSMYRHGLQAPHSAFLPLFGLPLAFNPSPEPLAYDGFRAILARLVRDLDAAEAELARVGDGPVKLGIDLARVRLDLDANGVADEREALPTLIGGLTLAPQPHGAPSPAVGSLPVGFDLADVYWMRGYANLLATSAEFFLAHDFRATFDATFHMFFPRAGLPFSRALAEPAAPGRDNEMGYLLDLVAFIHLVRWDVAEPQRLVGVHTRLKSVITLNRRTWAAVRTETDDDNEWLPGPHQKGALGLPVTEEMLTSWLAALDELDAVLDGRKLVPHPRFARGINVKRVLTEPRPFDLVLWVTGHGVLPYLEDGPVADGRAWTQASQVFRGQFLAYAFWFN